MRGSTTEVRLEQILQGIPDSPAVSGGRGVAFRRPALEIARRLPEGSVDLVYADPPFGTGRPRRSSVGAYPDPGGDRHLAALERHLRAFRRILSARGSLFVHLDWRSAPHARILLDGIFGSERLVNEIIWSYRTGGVARRHLARKHDTILFYAKTKDYTFHRLTERSDLAHSYGYANITVFHDENGPYRETYLRDVWEIPAIRGNMKEATGYPTQKPLPLIERILRLASSPGHVVFDPFTGSGTLPVAAERLGRTWIATDTSDDALSVLRGRLELAASRAG